MAFNLNPWHKPSAFRGNDSALVEFINKHHANHYFFGAYKKKNGHMKQGSQTWMANQADGVHHLIGTDSCKWDVPIKHYDTFLRLLAEEPAHYKWFFIEPMSDLHKMYLDFDFKTPAPVEYEGLVELVVLTCELVHHFFHESEMSCHVAACKPYEIKGKGLHKSGLHFYFNNVVTNSFHARKCRRYVVQELNGCRGDQDYNIPHHYDWNEIIDEKVFDAEPGSGRGALRLNNTYKVGHCKVPLCMQRQKAIRLFRAAQGETPRERSRRSKLSRERIYAELDMPDTSMGCCSDGVFADGSPYVPWLHVDENGHREATYASTLPHTNWSIMVDLGSSMSPFDKSLVPEAPVLAAAPQLPRGACEPRQNRVDKSGAKVTLFDSKALEFINREVIQKLGFKPNRAPQVCTEYASWISKQDGIVRPYRNAYASKVVVIYSGQDKGHSEREEKNFVFCLPLLGPDRHNCYGGQHSSNQARMHLSFRNSQYVDLTLTCFKHDCQFRPAKLRPIRFTSPLLKTAFHVLMQEGALLLRLKHCKPLPVSFKFDSTAKLNHADLIQGGRPEWPPVFACPHTTFDFALDDNDDVPQTPAVTDRTDRTDRKKKKKKRKVWATRA